MSGSHGSGKAPLHALTVASKASLALSSCNVSPFHLGLYEIKEEFHSLYGVCVLIILPILYRFLFSGCFTIHSLLPHLPVASSLLFFLRSKGHFSSLFRPPDLLLPSRLRAALPFHAVKSPAPSAEIAPPPAPTSNAISRSAQTSSPSPCSLDHNAGICAGLLPVYLSTNPIISI